MDIDSFIRAKAAIFSAINIMLSSLDMDVSVLSHVYVAGGIGSGINMENAVRIGMLPDIDRELFEYLATRPSRRLRHGEVGLRSRQGRRAGVQHDLYGAFHESQIYG